MYFVRKSFERTGIVCKGLLISMVLLVYISIVDWLQEHMLACPSKKFLHMECPGCGLQRSFFALVKGDIGKSLALYPGLLPIMVMLVYTFLHLKYDFKSGARNIKALQIFAVVVIFIFYVYKIMNNKIFG